jgi:hypothetical protein
MLKKILIVVVVLAAALAAIGFVLPGRYRVERSAVIAAPPGAVLAQAADLETWPEWSAWTREADPTCTFAFTGAGVGARMAWDGEEHGQGELTITKVDPAGGLLYELAFEHGEFLAHGGLDMAAEGAGTRVTMWSEGELGGNPLMHWMGLLMDSMVGEHFEVGLTGLKRRLEAAG